MAAALTYTSLIDQIPGYCERLNDSALIAQLPFIVMLAENRIATAGSPYDSRSHGSVCDLPFLRPSAMISHGYPTHV